MTFASLRRAEYPIQSLHYVPAPSLWPFRPEPTRTTFEGGILCSSLVVWGGVNTTFAPTPLGLASQDYRLARSKTSFRTSVFDLAKEVLSRKRGCISYIDYLVYLPNIVDLLTHLSYSLSLCVPVAIHPKQISAHRAHHPRPNAKQPNVVRRRSEVLNALA